MRRDPQIDLRRQLFALENKLIPSDGNTEVFNRELSKVVVPAHYCPHLIDPCPDELPWCKTCKQKTGGVTPLIPESFLVAVVRWLALGLLCYIIAAGAVSFL